MRTVKRPQPIATKQNKEAEHTKKLQEAAQLLQENKQQRERAFQAELMELQKKYGVSVSTQIVITAQ